MSHLADSELTDHLFQKLVRNKESLLYFIGLPCSELFILLDILEVKFDRLGPKLDRLHDLASTLVQ